jgi:hypothetical protein
VVHATRAPRQVEFKYILREGEKQKRNGLKNMISREWRQIPKKHFTTRGRAHRLPGRLHKRRGKSHKAHQEPPPELPCQSTPHPPLTLAFEGSPSLFAVRQTSHSALLDPPDI